MHNHSLVGQNLFEPSNHSIHQTPNRALYSTNQEIFLLSQKHSRLDPNSRAASVHRQNHSIGSDLFYNNQLHSKGIVVGTGIEQRMQKLINAKRIKQTGGQHQSPNRGDQMVLKEYTFKSVQKDNSPGPVLNDSVLDEEAGVCLACGLDFEEHAQDMNVDLVYYNQLLQDCFQSEHEDGAHAHAIVTAPASSRFLPEILSRPYDASSHVSQRELNSFAQIQKQILHNGRAGALDSGEGGRDVAQAAQRNAGAVVARSPRFNEQAEQRRSAQDHYFKGVPGSAHLLQEVPENERTGQLQKTQQVASKLFKQGNVLLANEVSDEAGADRDNDKSEDYFQLRGTAEEKQLNPISIRNETASTPMAPARLNALHF